MEKKQQATISACMIVKDEEKLLQGCIDSVINVVDEIVIVDTGSTDKTVDIAEQSGARVFYFKWCDDFSAARNYALEQIECDWALIIDADERMDQRIDVQALKEFLGGVDSDTVGVQVVNYKPDGQTLIHSERFLKRNKAHYEGIVHNQVVSETKPVSVALQIHHLGYNLDPETMAKKYHRTETLIWKQIEADDHNSFAWCNLFRIFRVQDKWDDLIRLAENFFSRVRSGEMESTEHAYQQSGNDLAYAYLQAKNYQKTQEICSDLLERVGTNMDATIYLAMALTEQNDLENAKPYYDRYFELVEEQRKNPKPTSLIMDSYGSEAVAYNNLGALMSRRGDKAAAEGYYKQALRENPDFSLAHRNLETTWQKLGEGGEPLNILFYQPSPCIRNRKQAAALRHKGHRVTLAYSVATLEQVYGIPDDEVYSATVKVPSPYNLWEIMNDYDLLHIHNEPDIQTVQALENPARAVPLVHDTHDLMTHKNSGNAILMPYALYMEHKANAYSDGRVYATAGQLIYALQQYRIDTAASLVLMNFTSQDDLPDKRLPKLSETHGGFHIVYQGGISANGSHRDYRELFQQIAALKLHIHIYPVFECAEYQQLDRHNKYIHYHEKTRPDELLTQLTQFDAGIICFNILHERQRPAVDLAVPNKLFEYMAAGLPVISKDLKTLHSLIDQYQCGIIFETAQDIKDQLDTLKAVKITEDHRVVMEDHIAKLVGFYRSVIGDYNAKRDQRSGKATPGQDQ